MRILVVEDEKRLADTLSELLTFQKYTVDTAYDGEEGLDNALTGIYDAIILDVMMPKRDGYSVVKELRAQGISTPVLMLTAKSEITDRVTGLDRGADYYLTKPFETEELLACLRALLRRREEVVSEELTFGGLTLNLSSAQLNYGGKELRLSAKEFEIFRLLMANAPNVVPKETILVKVWGYDSDAEDNHVEVYVSFLRKKLSHLSCPVTIESARKLGYFLKEATP